MTTVFIAMPYGDHNDLATRESNTKAAMSVWHQLADYGFLAYCPHLSHYLHEACFRSRSFWLANSVAWLEKCDCVLAIGESDGVKREIVRAWSLGKPVFRTMKELCDCYGVCVL